MGKMNCFDLQIEQISNEVADICKEIKNLQEAKNKAFIYSKQFDNNSKQIEDFIKEIHDKVTTNDIYIKK